MRKQRGTEVRKIADLFALYKKRLKAPQASVIKEVVLIITTDLHIPAKPHWFRYEVATRTMVCVGPAAAKSEILVHKSLILTEMKQRLGENNCPHQLI